MSQEIKLQPDERLNKTNFDEWKFLIDNVLKSKKILNYTETDLIGNLKENLKELKTNNLNNESTKKQAEKLEKQIEDTEACNALASTILITNVSKEILEYNKNRKSWIWNHTETEIVIWQPKKKSADSQYWMEDDILF